jgi:hypothetical protein
MMEVGHQWLPSFKNYGSGPEELVKFLHEELLGKASR